MATETTISVDIVSDVVCPWCYVGLKRLDEARALVDDVAVDVRWRPYQLDATIPLGGVDRRDYMLAKFGSQAKLDQIHDRLLGIGREAGIDFRFDRITVSPNTRDAHRVIRWAGPLGGTVQHDLARRLFRLYFEEGADIGDHTVLVEAAGEAGMDAAVVASLFATDADVAEVEQEIATAQRMGVTGVPCYLLEGKYAVMGAQDAATLADAFRQVAAARAKGEPAAG